MIFKMGVTYTYLSFTKHGKWNRDKIGVTEVGWEATRGVWVRNGRCSHSSDMEKGEDT